MQKLLEPKDLVEVSDAAVVATLSEVRLYGDIGRDSGTGKLHIGHVFYGPHVPGDVLQLRWRNKAICPRVDHQAFQGRPSIWFLRVIQGTTVEANVYVLPLDRASLERNCRWRWEDALSYPDDRVQSVGRFVREALMKATE